MVEELRLALLAKDHAALEAGLARARELGIDDESKQASLPVPWIVRNATLMYERLDKLWRRLLAAMESCDEDELASAITACETLGFRPPELEQARKLAAALRSAKKALIDEMSRGSMVGTYDMQGLATDALEAALSFATPVLGSTTRGIFLLQAITI